MLSKKDVSNSRIIDKYKTTHPILVKYNEYYSYRANPSSVQQKFYCTIKKHISSFRETQKFISKFFDPTKNNKHFSMHAPYHILIHNLQKSMRQFNLLFCI